MTRALVFSVLPLLVACACNGKDNGGDSGPTTTDSLCADLTATPNSTVNTAVTFSWTTEDAGTPSVTLDLEGEVTELTSTTEGTDHSLTAVGLVAGGEYTWTAKAGDITCPPQTAKVPPAPSITMKFNVTASEAGSAVADGAVVITILQSDSAWSAIVDGQGRFRFVHGTDEDWYTMAHTKMGRDGTSLLWNQFDRDRVLDVGSVARVSLDGTVDTRTRTYLAHHDFVELPDGTFGWLGYDRRDFAMDAVSAPIGADYATNCPGGQCPIAGEIILEGAEGITQDNEAIEIVNWWDDWDTDPSWVCDHMWDFDSFVPDYYEWMHANSLVYVDDLDAYFVMSRYTDRIFKVDRATGAIEWQLGGPDSDFTLNGGGEWFDHGHMSQVWDGGFLVFDNGDHRGLTKVSEYSFDETTMTAELVWTMDHPDGQMLPILGDVTELPNGNRLVVWSADALIQEITPAGEVVWEMASAPGSFGVVARAEYVADLPTQLP